MLYAILTAIFGEQRASDIAQVWGAVLCALLLVLLAVALISAVVRAV